MRKPRDIDAELKALGERQKLLRSRRTTQLGELVAATGADLLGAELLAGILLDAIEKAKADSSAKEAWQRRGEAFFRRQRRKEANNTGDAAQGFGVDRDGATPLSGGDQAG